MGGWCDRKLGDLLEIKHGYAFLGEHFGDAGTHIVLTPGNFYDEGGFKHKGDKEKWYAGPVPADYVLNEGDLLIAMTEQAEGLLGSSAVIPRSGLYLHNQRLGLVQLRDASKTDKRFVYYLFNSHSVRQQIRASASGVKIRHTAPSRIANVKVRVPPLPIQRRIGEILLAYDELIENDQRRIRILEEMTGALYREWFVDFRFPGRETINRVTSSIGALPKGWEVREMQEIADVIDCLHSKKPAERADGPGVLLQLNNIGEAGKLDMREQFRVSAEDYTLWTSRIELQAGDCVITNVGRVGAIAQIPEGVRAAPGRNMTAVRPRAGRLTPTYLIEYLLSSHMTSEIAKKKDLGTIMDSLNVKGIIRLHVPCPPLEAMLKFESIARPIRKRIEVLVDQIQSLHRTRDLLLPRLLSGQLDSNARDYR